MDVEDYFCDSRLFWNSYFCRIFAGVMYNFEGTGFSGWVSWKFYGYWKYTHVYCVYHSKLRGKSAILRIFWSCVQLKKKELRKKSAYLN